MGRPREPVKLIQAKGKAHMTKRQILDRRASEIEVPPAKIEPPRELDPEQRRAFRRYAKLLTEIGIFTVLDVDCLARYVRAQSQYDQLYDTAEALLRGGMLKSYGEVLAMQDKVFRQAQAAARDLGLTISSRCKLSVPPRPEDDTEL